MFATLCSNPITTKMNIGKYARIILDVSSLEVVDRYTADTTRMLHIIPSVSASWNGMISLLEAILKIVS